MLARYSVMVRANFTKGASRERRAHWIQRANVKPKGDHCDRAKGDHLGEKEKSAVVGRGKGSGEGGCARVPSGHP